MWFKSQRTYQLITALLFAVGIALFVVFINDVGTDKIGSLFVDLGLPALLIFTVVCSLINIFPAIVWYIHQRGEGLPISIYDSIKAHFMGFPINFLTPSMYLGSEPLKVYYVVDKYKYETRGVIATMIVTKVQEFSSILVLLLFSMLWIAAKQEVLSRNQEIIILTGMVAVCAVFGALIVTYANGLKPITRLFMALRMNRRFLVKVVCKIRDVEEIVHSCVGKRWKTFVLAQAFAMLSALSVLIRPLILGVFTPLYRDLVNFRHLALIFFATNIIYIFQPTPGGLGIFEYGMYGVSGVTGLSEASVAVFVLACRVSDIIWLLFGILLIIHFGFTAFLSAHKRRELRQMSAEKT